MLCEACGERGIFHVEQSGRSQRLLCDRCAQRALAELDPRAARFLAHWVPVRDGGLGAPDDLPDETRCTACGMTFMEFERQGLLGCGDCYQAFRSAVMPALAILHRSEGTAVGG